MTIRSAHALNAKLKTMGNYVFHHDSVALRDLQKDMPYLIPFGDDLQPVTAKMHAICDSGQIRDKWTMVKVVQTDRSGENMARFYLLMFADSTEMIYAKMLDG